VLDEAMASWSALLYFREVYGEQKAALIREDQLQGVYRLYRTFGGEDMDANRPSRDYRNTFQYAAVVSTKGALMFVELQRLLGADKLLAAFEELLPVEPSRHRPARHASQRSHRGGAAGTKTGRHAYLSTVVGEQAWRRRYRQNGPGIGNLAGITRQAKPATQRSRKPSQRLCARWQVFLATGNANTLTAVSSCEARTSEFGNEYDERLQT